MTCPACDAAHRIVSHLFHANCAGCAARAIARGRNFRKAQKDGIQDRWYRRELEQFGVTHAEVLAEHARDFLEKEPA
jgi:hypothetical protein